MTKKKLTKILLGISLSLMVIVGAFYLEGCREWHNLSNAEKCVYELKTIYLGQNTMMLFTENDPLSLICSEAGKFHSNKSDFRTERQRRQSDLLNMLENGPSFLSSR